MCSTFIKMKLHIKVSQAIFTPDTTAPYELAITIAGTMSGAMRLARYLSSALICGHMLPKRLLTHHHESCCCPGLLCVHQYKPLSQPYRSQPLPLVSAGCRENTPRWSYDTELEGTTSNFFSFGNYNGAKRCDGAILILL